MANVPRRSREPARKPSVPRDERAAWEAENRDAIDAYNGRAERRGVFSDQWQPLR